MSRELDDLDRRLLEALQEGIPFVSAPFAALGDRLGTTQREIMARLIMLKAAPRAVIRQISAIFDSQSLGYQSCLVAAKVAPNQLEKAAAVISAHPGVSHNYQREHDYNLWYTLAVPPDSRLGLDRTIDILRQRSGASAMRKLQTIKLFKIGVNFKLSGDGHAKSPAPSAVHHQSKPSTMTESDKQLIRVLQQDMPIVPKPWQQFAAEAGTTEEHLLSEAARFMKNKWMRRFAAVLHHRQAGFDANAMGVWIVDQAKQESFGAAAAGFPEVSHCYLRPSYEDWPYNIFTMVHAHSREKCEQVLKRISDTTGIKQYRSLYSTREFKKTRVSYFTDDIPAWERDQADAGSFTTL
jgi:DNA-binding Lrp family transcriptional regulator